MRRAIPILFHVGLCLIGVAATFRPDWSSGFQKSVIDFGDGALNNCFLEHTYQLLTNRNYAGGLWSPAFFYPVKGVLTYSDNLFGTAPIYWLLRLALPPHFSMLAWVAANMVLCYGALAYVLRRWRVGHALCGAGAYVFAFGMPRVMACAQPQLMPQVFTPLALFYLFAFLRVPTIRRLNAAMLLIFWQLAAGIYLGWFLALGASACVVVALVVDRGQTRRMEKFLRARPIATVVSMAVWIGVIVAFMHPYQQHRTRDAVGGWSYWFIEPSCPNVATWLQPPPRSFWRSYLARWPGQPERDYEYLFNGAFPLLAAAAAVVAITVFRRRTPAGRRWMVKLSLITFAVIVFLSLRFLPGTGPWEGIYDLFPGAKAIRYVWRIWTVAYAFLLFGGILGLDALLRATISREGQRAIVAIVLAVLALSEQFAVPRVCGGVMAFQHYVDDEIAMIQGAGVGILLIDEQKTPGPEYQFEGVATKSVAMMLAGMKAGVPVINGFSGWLPANYGPFAAPTLRQNLLAWLGPNWHKTICILVETQDAEAWQEVVRQWPGAPIRENGWVRALTVTLDAQPPSNHPQIPR